MKGKAVTYPTDDGGTIGADLYEGGAHGVLLAHGKIFDKDTWRDLPAELVNAGFTALTPNFRGYGNSTGPETDDGMARDVAAGVAYLRENGAETVSVIGASMGAVASARAVSGGLTQDLANLILLSPRIGGEPEKLVAGHVLFVVSEGEDCLQLVSDIHAAAPGEKSLKVFDGDAHAQFIFKGPHEAELTGLILETLGK